MPIELKEDEKLVDINDTSLWEGEEQDFDPTEDWQGRACPPPKGRYIVKLFGDKTWTQAKKTGFAKDDKKGVYYKTTITCKIQDESGKWNNSILEFNASTGIPRGKTMSNVTGLLTMAKVKIPPNVKNERAKAALFTKWVNTEPLMVVEADWQSWDSENKDAKNPVGTRLKFGMVNYPKKADGIYSHILKGCKGQEVYAKLKVVKWHPKGTSLVVAGAGAKPVVKPVVPVKKPEPVEEVVMEDVQENTEELVFDGDGEIVFTEE